MLLRAPGGGKGKTMSLAVHPLHCSSVLQDIAQAMLRQMQHIQHAGGDPTAEELRFSSADLLQALKVQTRRLFARVVQSQKSAMITSYC